MDTLINPYDPIFVDATAGWITIGVLWVAVAYMIFVVAYLWKRGR